MLVAGSSKADGTWQDSSDSTLRWAMPGGLGVHHDEHGDPEFLLARWGDRATGASGGLLRVRLDALPPVQIGARAVAFAAVRTRIAVRALDTDTIVDLGDWRDVPPGADPLVTVVETLDATSVQLLDDALDGDVAAIEVFVEGVADAVTRGLPVLAVVDPEHLARLLEPGGQSVQEIAAALLSLPRQAVTITVLDGGPAPDRDVVLIEVAHRVVACLTLAPDDGWTPPRYEPPTSPVPNAYDLRPPRPSAVRFAASWSVTDLVDALDPVARDRLLPRLDDAGPFEVSRIVIVNTVPMDARCGVRSVQVDVVTSGSAGLPERHSFVFDGDRSTRHFTAVSAVWPRIPPPPHASGHAVLAAAPQTEPPWPRILADRPIPVTGMLVTVTPADLGVRIVTVSATPEVLALAADVHATVSVALQAMARVALAPGPSHLAYLDEPGAVLTITADGEDIRTEELTEQVSAVTIVASDLVDLEPVRISVRRGADGAPAAFVAVTLEGGTGTSRTFTLEPQTADTWMYHRRTKTTPVLYRWQLHWIPIATDGATQPLRSSPWTESEQIDLIISVPRREEP
jgi:hypothetical protein